MEWNLRTCARKGHVTYAPDEADLRVKLEADTPLGDAWRCLRCGTYVLGEPHGTGPAEDAPVLLRGKALRAAFILRALAIERWVRGIVLVLLAVAVLKLKTTQVSLQDLFDRDLKALKPFFDQIHFQVSDSSTVTSIEKILHAKSSTLNLIALGLFLYGALQIVEGIGLWSLKRWGEYVAVVGTTAFIPLEIYEVVDQVSWLKIVVLVINVVAVVYLLLSKRLFGIRGGHAPTRSPCTRCRCWRWRRRRVADRQFGQDDVVPDNDLLPLLQERLKGLYSPLLADITGSILFTAGGMANWTVEIDQGRTSARRGGPDRPTTTVRASLPVLDDVVRGTRSGVAAFLDGELTVRGNLALALQLDGLFPGSPSDVTRTHTRSVRAGGLETFYLESGPTDAPPIVLVHGLSATNASMLPLIPALSREYHVLAPDLPGHGGTEALGAAHGAGYLGNWLCAFLRETCDRPAVLVGNSLGGRTSLQAALDEPDLVRGLVLLCPAVAFRRLRQLVPVRAPRPGRDRDPAGPHPARHGHARPAPPVRRAVPTAAAVVRRRDRRVPARARAAAQPVGDVLGAAACLPGRAVRRQRILGPAARPHTAGAVPVGQAGRPRAGRVRPLRQRRPAGRAVRGARRLRPRAAVRAPGTDLAADDGVPRDAARVARQSARRFATIQYSAGSSSLYGDSPVASFCSRTSKPNCSVSVAPNFGPLWYRR